MQAGEECGYCETILDVHCTLHGAAFCDLKEQYYTDETMTVDDVYDRLYQIATPQQMAEALPLVEDRVRQVTAAPTPNADWIGYWQKRLHTP